MLVAVPYLASRPHASAASTALVLAVYRVGSLVCHQLRDRSFHLWTAQMPVCARCVGIYFGAVVGALGARLLVTGGGSTPLRPSGSATSPPTVGMVRSGARRVAGLGMRPERSLRYARVLLAVAVAPTALTLAYEWSTSDMPSHALRAAAGVPIGLVIAWLVVAAADNQVN
jgi:hypothetical protein